MDYLLENLSLVYNTSGWSYDALSQKLNEGVPQMQQFSRDQIRFYEQRLSTPKAHFKNVLARFLGVEVKEITDRKITVDEIEQIINKSTNDAGQEILSNQYEILAQQRVILSLLASIKKPSKTLNSDNVRNTLQMMVEEEKAKVLKDKRRKAGQG